MKIVADSISALVFRRKRGVLTFLMLKRVPQAGGFWQSVSGRVEKKETAEEAAVRETLEETGLQAHRLIPVDYINAYYLGGDVHLEPCFGVEVGPGRVRLSDEHEMFRWLDGKRAHRLMRWPGNRAALEHLMDELRREEGS